MTRRELAHRENDGLQISLHWHPSDDGVSLSVADLRTGEILERPVARERAFHAFQHPFAYLS